MPNLLRPQELNWGRPLNPHTPQADGLVFWCPFLPIFSPVAHVLHGSVANGAMNGSLSWTVDADFLAVPDFDGSNDDVSFGDVLDFERTDRFSIAAWLRRDVAGPQCTICSKCVGDGTARGYLFFWTGNKIAFILSNNISSGNYLYVTSTSTFTDTDWTHVVATFDGSSNAAGVLLYRNGVPLATTTVADGLTSTTVSAASFRIGGRDLAVDWWDGQIGEVRIYNRVKTADEIWEMYSPSTRWELYRLPERPTTGLVQPAGATAVGRSVRADWDILSAIAKQVRLDWDIRVAVGRAVEIDWDVHARVGRAVEIDWDLLAASGRALRLDWNVQTEGATKGVLWAIDRRGVTWEVAERKAHWELNGERRGALFDVGGR